MNTYEYDENQSIIFRFKYSIWIQLKLFSFILVCNTDGSTFQPILQFNIIWWWIQASDSRYVENVSKKQLPCTAQNYFKLIRLLLMMTLLPLFWSLLLIFRIKIKQIQNHIHRPMQSKLFCSSGRIDHSVITLYIEILKY